MANFLIGEKICAAMISRCHMLAARRRVYAEDGFPLSVEQIQRAVMHPRETALLQRMLNDGMTVLESAKEHNISVLLDNANLHISRSAVVDLRMPTDIFVPKRNGWYGARGAQSLCHEDGLLHLDISRLEDEACQTLARWTNNVVREYRLETLVNATVRSMLERHLPTVYHAMVRWPVVAALVPEHETLWRARFAEKPRSARAYEWPTPATSTRDYHYVPSVKARQAAEMVIAGASMLPPVELTPGAVQTHILAWQPLETDPDYVLPS